MILTHLHFLFIHGAVLFSDHGPNFYIVLSDKINEQEVNKQEVHFAKIIEGKEILDYIAENHHNGNFGTTFMVGIESIRMLEAIEEGDDEDTRWLPLSQRKIEYRVRED